MKRSLRVLLVEDFEPDAELVVRELRRCDFEVTWERVDSQEGMRLQLDRTSFDVIISDYKLPTFSAPAALELVKARGLDVPFIIVSGTVGEETAVEAIRAGAHDFLVKGRFARLGSVIERELRDVGLRAERMKMREQLLISDRMSSVGTLAAGLAHEINNPLAVVVANLECTVRELAACMPEARAVLAADGRRELDENTIRWFATRISEVLEPLADARLAADRVKVLVRDLKLFSRPEEEKPGAVDIHRVIETAVRMAHNEIRHRAEYVQVFGDVPAVAGVEARLGQVLLNLIVNAAQAMPEGRVATNQLRITTSVDAQRRVVVEVRDTGTGIPEALRSRIFDPFFTTKPVGVGTGLGLSICHRLVTDMGGEIQVESEVGHGTAVRLVLPSATATLDAVAAEVAKPSATVPLRLLIIDDDASLGAALRRTLSRDHHVITVNNVDMAFNVLRQSEAFDAIVCDLMMPQTTGMDFYHLLETHHPQLAKKVVFMTAGAFTRSARDFLERVDNPRLEKPFTPSHLINTLRGLPARP